MNTAALPQTANAAHVKARFSPIRSLIEMWERDGVDEDEPATDISVMLSGMMGQQFFGGDQD